ncbi:hypothetical protein [Halomicrococcus gelatinilyticus]
MRDKLGEWLSRSPKATNLAFALALGCTFAASIGTNALAGPAIGP